MVWVGEAIDKHGNRVAHLAGDQSAVEIDKHGWRRERALCRLFEVCIGGGVGLVHEKAIEAREESEDGKDGVLKNAVERGKGGHVLHD